MTYAHTTTLAEMREDWRAHCADTGQQGGSLVAAFRWVGNPAEVDTETLIAAIDEVASTYPADEWQNTTWMGHRLLMADLLTGDAPPTEVARRVMLNYRQGESFGRLARYANTLTAMLRRPVGVAVGVVVVTLDGAR